MEEFSNDINTYKKIKDLIHGYNCNQLGVLVNPTKQCYDDYNLHDDDDDDDNEFNKIKEIIDSFPYEITPDYCQHNITIEPNDIGITKDNVYRFLSDLSNDELLKYADKSTYGDLKTNTTVYDPKVRTAYEIKSTNIIFSESLRNKLELLESKVSKELYFRRKIKFKLNKLNIYTKGGFFKEHVDTPKLNNIGTFVIVLPDYKFEGGEFYINGHDVMTKSLIDEKDSSQLQNIKLSEPYNLTNTIAFYSNLKHKVKKVNEGIRITLTFYIETSFCNEPIESYVPKLDNFDNFIKEFDNLLKIHNEIGLTLSHDYSLYESSNKLLKSMDAKIINHLKKNYNVGDLFPVLIRHNETSHCEDGNEIDVCVLSFSMKMNKKTYKPKNINFICLNRDSENLYENRTEINYTGNECDGEEVNSRYYQMAVIIKENMVC